MKTLHYSAPECEELELDCQNVLCQSPSTLERVEEENGSWS